MPCSHLEEARELARRIERPYQEIAALAHLGVAVRMTGRPSPTGSELLEQAVALAEAHGWADDPIEGAPALAFLGSELSALAASRRRSCISSAQSARWPERGRMTELVVRYAWGMLRFGQGRLEDALAAFRQTERMRPHLSEDVINRAAGTDRAGAGADGRDGSPLGPRSTSSATEERDSVLRRESPSRRSSWRRTAPSRLWTCSPR